MKSKMKKKITLLMLTITVLLQSSVFAPPARAAIIAVASSAWTPVGMVIAGALGVRAIYYGLNSSELHCYSLGCVDVHGDKFWVYAGVLILKDEKSAEIQFPQMALEEAKILGYSNADTAAFNGEVDALNLVLQEITMEVAEHADKEQGAALAQELMHKAVQEGKVSQKTVDMAGKSLQSKVNANQ
jgi:hypothetical protein